MIRANPGGVQPLLQGQPGNQLVIGTETSAVSAGAAAPTVVAGQAPTRLNQSLEGAPPVVPTRMERGASTPQVPDRGLADAGQDPAPATPKLNVRKVQQRRVQQEFTPDVSMSNGPSTDAQSGSRGLSPAAPNESIPEH